VSAIVVIGAALSELVAAAYLKRARHEVIVLDENATVAQAPALPCDSGWIPDAVVRELELERYGLVVQATQLLPTHLTQVETRWPAFCERMAKLARLLESIYCAPPPDPLTESLSGYRDLGELGLRVRGLGREATEHLLRLLPMSAADLLDEWFGSDALKGALGAVSVCNLAQGPRSGGTAFNLLHHHVGNAPGAFGVPRSNARDVLRRLLATQIRAGRAANIEVREGVARSVVLSSGEELPASAVVSGADPVRTLTDLVDPGWLDPELVRAVRNIRARGVAARVRLAFDTAVDARTLTLPPSLDAIERAYDDWKYGRASAAPVFHSIAPAQDNPGVVDIHVQYVPHDLPHHERESARKDLGAHVAHAVADRLGARVTSAVVDLPQDLEANQGFPQGQPNHTELGLDQILWMRPVPQLAAYLTPITSLYLCGPAMHPGIAAATGMNAAKAIERDLKRRS
jgi:phytoene dehydrogenase-like protein